MSEEASRMNFYQMLLSPLMALEILFAEIMFCKNAKKKDYYWIRLLSLTFVSLGIIVWIEIFYVMLTNTNFSYNQTSSQGGSSLFKLIYFLVIYGLTLIILRTGYEGNWWNILCYGSCGYALEHLLIGVCTIFDLIPVIADSISLYSWLSTVYEILFLLVLYPLAYLLLLKNKSFDLDNRQDVPKKVLISLFVILICVGLSRLTRDNLNRNMLSIFSESLYSILCCSFILFNLTGMAEKEKIQDEVFLMKEMLHREREQYKLSKENIELINIKCHDLKHQLSALKNNPDDKSIEEMKKAIMIYDSTVKTGNDVLDVILTEKSLYCESHHIILTCMADGEKLSFMEASDLYSLFGNALSNAIESVMDIKDTEKRAISLNVSAMNNILSIHIENFFSERPDFEDGLPITSKDKDYHGFGMKSMDRIAKKYHGGMKALIKEDKFSLDFVLPIS